MDTFFGSILKVIEALEKYTHPPEQLKSHKIIEAIYNVFRVAMMLLVCSLLVLVATAAIKSTYCFAFGPCGTPVTGAGAGAKQRETVPQPKAAQPKAESNSRALIEARQRSDRVASLERQLADERLAIDKRVIENASIDAARARCIVQLDDPNEITKKRFNSTKPRGDCDSPVIGAREEKALCFRIRQWCDQNDKNIQRCDYDWSQHVRAYCENTYKTVAIDRSREERLDREIWNLRAP
jgi:hypothetical protein